jgi:hypothetical protein
MTQVTEMEFEEAVSHDMAKPRPKVGRIPVTLRLLNETEAKDDKWEDTTHTSRKGDTQFMLLLVTLFIVVNLVLVVLLNHKDKTSAAKPEVASPVILPMPSVAKQNLPPPPPPVVTTSGTSVPSVPAAASRAYVTPSSPDSTKTIAAPFHPVTVTDHAAPDADTLTVIHAPNITPGVVPTITVPASAMPEIAPAAGSAAPPAAISPEAATQDLLSVINRE